MKKDKILSAVWGVMIGVFIFGCQQLPEDDALITDDSEESMQVEVRSAEGKEIAYPVYLYAFEENGKLVASQTVKSSEDKISLTMSEGDYKLVAVSGASDIYQLPENPALGEKIIWESSEGSDEPLMLGRADVVLGRSADKVAELTLSHVVAALNVTFKNVPTNASEVQLILSPLYSSLTLGGEYGGNSQKVKVNCSQTGTGVWSGATTYIFPGCGKETIFSICLKFDNGSEVTYGYTYKGVPEPNKLFNVKGSYSDGIILEGDFDINDWEGAIDVEFDFGANVLPDDTEEEGDDNNKDNDDLDLPLEGTPEIGSIWNDMLVVDLNEVDDGGVDLLLMSLDEWEVITSQVDEVLEGYSVNGLSGWRLPSHDEAALLRARFSGNNRLELNDLIAEYDDGLYGLAGGDKERYLCLKENDFYSFQFIGGTRTTKAGEKRSYYLRLVKTYHID